MATKFLVLDVALPELSEKLLQPVDMTFPRRPFGKTKVVTALFRACGTNSGSGCTTMRAMI